VGVMRDWFPSPLKWLLIRFESGPDYKINVMNNKINIHKMEEIGFFIAMTVVSIVIGMAIVSGIIKIVDLLNK